MTLIESRVHLVAVQRCVSPLMGRTFQPRCDRCGFQGGHYQSEQRAIQAAREHRDRAAGFMVMTR